MYSKKPRGNGLRSDFLDSVGEGLKHIVPTKTRPPIKSKGVFIEVALQILLPDVVIDATDTVLSQAPEAFNRIVCASPET